MIDNVLNFDHNQICDLSKFEPKPDRSKVMDSSMWDAMDIKTDHRSSVAIATNWDITLRNVENA